MCSLQCLAIVLGGVIALTGRVVSAHDGESDHQHPPKADAKQIYKPSLVPDRVVLTWTGDPATSQSVTWRTSQDVSLGLAEIAIAEAGPAFATRATTVEASSQDLATDLNLARFHTVDFQGLKPATRYAYRVGDGVNWSEWFQFSTASESDEPFSFIYFGDAQNNIKSLWSRVIREAHRDQPKARFLLHAGDLVNRADSDAEWGEWCGAGKWLNAMIPNIAIPGNHEQAKQADGTRRLSKLWRHQFAFPTNGPEGLEETCYTLVYQGVRIIGMNSNTRLEDQAQWLDDVLAKNDCRWVVCTFHHPIFSTGNGRDNSTQRNLWKPVLDKHKVDLVLQGHDHTYGRTGLETPLAEPPDKNVATGVNTIDKKTGTVYVVSVSGPKMYAIQTQPFMKRMAEDTQLYQIIHVDGNELKYEARTAIGELYDAFTLVKQPGSINRLIDQIPNTPPRRMDSKRTEAVYELIFRSLDANKDGKLVGKEIPDALSPFMEQLDLNKDGELSREEVQPVIERLKGRVTSGDGKAAK